ncbi:unnamed protein product [Litomosoides sigmodontis]|uniref:Uncharacterized protein n=1 Tax=Litomosoides sigmodontis TaxID=42156 RepID=A0A3P6SZ65_LITSI|nr:unnamed protein product [Litomosoides sigmodontis]
MLLFDFVSALLLAWRLLLSNGKDEKNKASVDVNRKDDASSVNDIDSISSGATSATTSIGPAAMESASSIESLKALLSTDSISDDRTAFTASAARQEHFLTESLLLPQCSTRQHVEYFLGYGSSIYNTERHLLAIPELEEENDELPGSQWSGSPSSTTTAKPSALANSGSAIRPVSSNSDQPISLHLTATDHAPDLINHNQPSNSSLTNLSQNSRPKPSSSDQVISIDSLSHPAGLHRPTFKPLLTVPHPSVPPPPPPFSLLKSPLPPLAHPKEVWNDTSSPPLPLPSIGAKLAAATTPRHLAFDIPGGHCFLRRL